MLTCRKQQRLYFGLGVKDVPAAQDALTWFLKIEPLSATSPNDTTTAFARFKFIKLFPLQLNRGWMWSPVSAHRNKLSPPFPSLSTSLNGEPRSTCLHKEEIRRGQKFIKERENPHSARPPWTDNGPRWRSRVDNAADLSHSATSIPPFTFISLHHFSVFSHQINRSRIERLTWNYLEK